MTNVSGVWLPVITPFLEGALDLASYDAAIEDAIDDDEVERLVDRTVTVVAGRVPIFVGVGGNATHKVLKTLTRISQALATELEGTLIQSLA